MELLIFSFITILGYAFYQMFKPIDHILIEYQMYRKEKMMKFQENGVKFNA